MDETIYDAVYFTLVTEAHQPPADVAAALLAMLMRNNWLPIAEEHGVHFIGRDSETGQVAEGYLVAEDREDALSIAKTLNSGVGTNATSGARPSVRFVGPWSDD